MATQAQAKTGTLPGRRHVAEVGRVTAVRKYASAIQERVDLTPAEKRASIEKYARGMGVDVKEVEDTLKEIK